ncbi:MAG TPA: NADP-dependent oxidoreductase [Chthoniobacterales bacterium]|nr:NADP-dependent oxidoreductase [Chthoniobacterales bacterium]
MKAIVIHGYGGPEVLKYEDYPDPVVSAGEVLVRVAASSVNPFDFKVRSGAMKDFIPLTFPAILGLDIAGTVDSVGPGVTTFRPGDKVFAHTSQAYAECCVVKAASLAKIPEGADLVNMAALPTVTTTGAQLAYLALGEKSGVTVLVTGAIGNVGRSAVYAAKSRGARVIAGVLKRHVTKAQAAGADSVIALDDALALKGLDAVDAVADTVGGPTADEVLDEVKPGGIFASVLGPPSKAGNYPKVQVKAMQVAPDALLLRAMADAVHKRGLTIPLGERFSLRNAGMTHAAAEKGSAGKILLLV